MNHPFSATRAELLAELHVLIQCAAAKDILGRTNIGLTHGERVEIERSIAARFAELLRKLFPVAPRMEDIITSRAHETGIHEAAPKGEGLEAVDVATVAAGIAGMANAAQEREHKLRELARDLLDALHAPVTSDRGEREARENILKLRAHKMAEFVLEEKDG